MFAAPPHQLGNLLQQSGLAITCGSAHEGELWESSLLYVLQQSRALTEIGAQDGRIYCFG